ncbi:hypothetical protein BH20ACT24_BH20ACT24_13650 [soil metagenome]
MIPLPDLAVELVLGFGAALFAANAWVLLRPAVARRTGSPPPPQPRSRGRVVLNMVLGAVAAVWALATIVVR